MENLFLNNSYDFFLPEGVFQPVKEFSFPLAGTITDFKVSQHIFILLLEGRCTVKYDSFPQIVAEKEEFFFIPYGSVLTAGVIPGTRLIAFSLPLFCELYDSYEVFFQILKEYKPIAKPAIHPLPFKNALGLFLKSISLYLESGLKDKNLYEIKIREFLLILAAYYNKQELSNLFETLISRDPQFAVFVFRNWKKVKTVQELIELSAYNEVDFIYKFVEVFRVTPHEWLDREKRARILHELKYSKKLFKVIAKEFGFTSLQMFTNYCRHHFNDIPARIRYGF